MASIAKTTVKIGLLLIIVAIILFRLFAGGLADRSINGVFEHEPFDISPEAEALHKDLFIADWHTDTLMWPRNLNRRADHGHVDLPRLQGGNIATQMFTTVTKSPPGQNYESNSSQGDRLTPLFIAQGWPVRTWDSLFERAMYQAEKLARYVDESEGGLIFVATRQDYTDFVRSRQQAIAEGKTPPVAALLGSEGGHPFEGDLEKIDAMFAAGFRMFGLTHFFDNELGGSLHGLEKSGLTSFGRAAVKRLDELGAIIDLAHASEQMAWDVLALTDRPVVVSHTGFKGDKPVNRNFPDDLMKAIADKGGLIAVGFWDGAVDDAKPASIAKAIKYGIGLVGADHVALGSDWDGATTTIMADELLALTDALLDAGVSETDIRKVMGENTRAFLIANLPE